MKELLELLSETEHRTASEIGEALGISERTARNRLKELKRALDKEKVASLISQTRYGYHLQVIDRSVYEKFLSELRISADDLPQTGKERSDYLLAYLVNQDSYVKMADLCEFLFVSESTLSGSMRFVEQVLNRFHLTLERRPNYGIKVQGSEFDIRKLVEEYFVRSNYMVLIDKEHQQKEMLYIAEIIQNLFGEYKISISEIAFDAFVSYVYVAQKRMQRGHYIIFDGTQDFGNIELKEYSFVEALTKALEEKGYAKYNETEKQYLVIYLSGKRIIGNKMENDTNFVIQEKIDLLVIQMLQLIDNEYKIDLRNDFELRMALNQHLVPLDIRLRYNIPYKNPILDEIKKDSSLAYDMAYRTSEVLKSYYKREIPEDEIGYIALIIALALERKKDKNHKFSILLICSTGKGTSRLLKYRYQHEFEEYLREIFVCDLLELKNFDFQKVDYVFTTVPIPYTIPRPIVEVGSFLTVSDIQKVTGVLRKGTCNYLWKYFTKERFIAGMPGETKEEILDALCDIIYRQEQVEENFRELVYEREGYVQMDYGNMVAIPHPNRLASEYTFVYVVVLDKAVIWVHKPVQVIILTSVGREEDPHRNDFYDATAKLALSENAIETLIAVPKFDVLKMILQELN